MAFVRRSSCASARELMRSWFQSNAVVVQAGSPPGRACPPQRIRRGEPEWQRDKSVEAKSGRSLPPRYARRRNRSDACGASQGQIHRDVSRRQPETKAGMSRTSDAAIIASWAASCFRRYDEQVVSEPGDTAVAERAKLLI